MSVTRAARLLLLLLKMHTATYCIRVCGYCACQVSKSNMALYYQFYLSSLIVDKIHFP